MPGPDKKKPRVLVIDVGGSNVKLLMADRPETVKIKSGSKLTPTELVGVVNKAAADFEFDVISMGLPTPVKQGMPVADPTNLGKGWVGFDFSTQWNKPLRVINDAALQALGSWEGGRMLFLGLGTGLGSAFVVDGTVIPLELCDLPFAKGKTMEQCLSKVALKKIGQTKWQKSVHDAVAILRAALLPDHVILGGGNAKFLTNLPPGCEIGDNRLVMRGAERLWEIKDGRLHWQIA